MKPLLTVLLLTALITGIEWGLLTLLTEKKYPTRTNTALIKTNGQVISPAELLRLRAIVQSNNRTHLQNQTKQSRHSDGRRSW